MAYSGQMRLHRAFPERPEVRAMCAKTVGGDSGGVAQIGEDGEHGPVGFGVGVEAEFEKDLLDVGFDGALGAEQEGYDAVEFDHGDLPAFGPHRGTGGRPELVPLLPWLHGQTFW